MPLTCRPETALLAVTLTWWSCLSDHALPPLHYVQWVETTSNGLHVQHILDSYLFTLQYKPSDYIIVKEQRQKELDRAVVNTERAALDGLQYYTFRIGIKGGSLSLMQHLQRKGMALPPLIRYFSFDLRHDLQLVDGSDTLDCHLFHFERTYGMTPYLTFVLAFEQPSREQVPQQKTFIYRDKVLGTGPVKLRIRREALASLPRLKTRYYD